MKYKIILLIVIFIGAGCSDTNPKIQQPKPIVNTSPLTPADASDLQWWGTARAEIRRMLKDTNRTEKGIEQPKWFESEYSTLGRMPLIDTALANPLLLPEIAMYFDKRCKNNSDSLWGLFLSAGAMADQSDNPPATMVDLLMSGDVAEAIRAIKANKDIPLNAKEIIDVIINAVNNSSLVGSSAFGSFTPEGKIKTTELLSHYFIKEKDGKNDIQAYTVEDTTDNVELIGLLQKVDFNLLLISARFMTEAIDKVKLILKKSDFTNTNDTSILFDKETSIGRIIVGNTGNNTYTEDAAIIIDLGGDDQYLNNAGGTRPGKINAAIVIDVSGNDTYQGQDFCQGCGYLGVGALVDMQGNDTYTGRNFCQGAALGGFGFLYDGAGDDTYTADFGAQSAAIFGYSILSERAGNDSYKCSMFGQAGASTMGVAILAEAAGNDTYQGGGKYPFYSATDSAMVQGAAMGMRPWPVQGKFTLYGGIALLSDAAGDDRYSAQAFAQGGSYILSLGMCVDSAGNDFYSGTDYCQGSGCHLGAACLIDRAGNDVYTATNHSTGGSLDRSAGVLLDIRGNDRYNSPDGVGYAGKPRGCGIFVDCLGDDRYEVGVYGRARYPYAENTQSSTFFLDMGGKDKYDANRPLAGWVPWSDNQSWQQGEWGMSRDWQAVPVETDGKVWAPMTQPNLDYKMVHVEGCGEIIEQAQSLNTLTRFGAFTDIVNAGDKAVDIIYSLAGSWNPFTLRDLIDITETMRLRKLFKEGDNSKLSRLLLSSNKDISLLGATYFFRTINSQSKPVEDIIDALSERALKDESPEVRSIAVLALGKTGDVNLLPVIEKCLQDKDWIVRRRAVMALGYMKDRYILVHLLDTEKAYQVRAQIVSVMGRLGDPVFISYIKRTLEPDKQGVYENDFTRYYAARALAVNFHDKYGIIALIGLLDIANSAITDEILGILKELTKQDLGKYKDKWLKWLGEKNPDLEKKEDDIKEAVFRYQFEHNESGCKDEAAITYLLCLGSYDISDTKKIKMNKEDPSDEFMQRFKDNKHRVEKASQFSSSDRERLLFTIWNIRWMSDNEVEVDGEYYAGPLNAAGHIYRLQFKDNKWVVVKDTLIWIS